jgi:hypothetical protein
VIQNVILRKPERHLDLILYGDHCDHSKDRSGCLKQLNQLFHIHQYNPTNTVIIDDNKNVFDKQKNGVIPIRPFEFFKKGSETDDHLAQIRDKFLRHK